MLGNFAVFVAFAICLGFLVATIWERIRDGFLASIISEAGLSGADQAGR